MVCGDILESIYYPSDYYDGSIMIRGTLTRMNVE